MIPAALAPYEQALDGAAPLVLSRRDGVVELDVSRWLGRVDAHDATVLDRCTGPVLDVGSGPGRFVAALSERGVAALGVDIAERAVRLSRARGAPALVRDVFARVPGEGRWPTLLLMDGNLGIGGDVAALFARARTLAAPAGQVIVETDPDADTDEQSWVRFVQDGTPVGPSFRWAWIGRAALERYAGSAGFVVAESWSSGGREFARLRSRTTRTA